MQDEQNKQLPASQEEDEKIKDQTKIDLYAKEIDIHDPNSLIYFAANAQEQINAVSDSMLEGVKNKDLSSAGDSLNNLVTVIKGFDVDELNPNAKQGFFAKLFGLATPIAKFLNRYEDVRKQIDTISDELENHKTQLLTDIASLDRLYDVNLDYLHELELYISAGEKKLKELDEKIIPKLEAEAKKGIKIFKAINLKDVKSTRDALERKIHDLKLTRTVAMQSLPSIRLVQENDKNLISKIDSTLINTLPLWKNQLAQTITIYRSAKAAKAIKGANDLTNELLEENAKNLKDANKAIREEIERGVFDIESIKKANKTLIETINESLKIAEEGKRARENAQKELLTLQQELKSSLMVAGAKIIKIKG